LGVEFKDLAARFPPAVIVFESFADERDMGVLKFVHAGAAAMVDGEVPVDVAAVGMTGAMIMDGADKTSADEAGHGGREVNQRIAGRG